VTPPVRSGTDRPTRRIGYGIAAAAGLVLVALIALTATGRGPFSAAPASPPPSSVAVASGTPTNGPTADASAAPGPTATPVPTPTAELVPAPLTGLPVSPAAAEQHVMVVMVDDLRAARPQSGFNAASIVWQAPAEGGIPRYELFFQDTIPGNVGPVRSSRQYFIEWASEWHAVYVHAGGSPQALATLAAMGHGQWVWNADALRYEGRYLLRVKGVQVLGGPFFPLSPPHNLYTSGTLLRRMAATIGAKDGPLTPVWTFGPDAMPEDRPSGARLTVAYPYETISYRYDAASNTYRRYITSGGALKPQLDAATGTGVAPKNVVILTMAFGPLNDGHPNKHRLEASDVGHGTAWISTNGITVKGTWRKASATAPTLLFGPGGKPIVLTAGQTFVQVLPIGSTITLRAGHLPAPQPISRGGESAY
jgi:DUF3048 family protein